MKEILAGIHQWQHFNEQKQMDFNGVLIGSAEGCAVVDPPPMTREDKAFLRAAGKVIAIYITNRHHVRDTETLRKETGAPVWMHEKDAPLVDVRIDKTFTHGARLPGGLEVIEMPHSKSPGESAFLLREKRCLILGDALIGKPAGELNLLPADKFKDPQKAKEGIRVLLDVPFNIVLVGDGACILQNGRKAVEEFLERA